jgi:hypothetical protein
VLDTKRIIAEIDAVLKKHEEYRSASKYDDLSDLKRGVTNEVLTLLEATLERAAPPRSIYKRHAEDAYAKYGHDNAHNITILTGVLNAIRADYEAGRLQSVTELIHADLFADFLEMAEYLQSEGYKDAAAVICGSVLEGHLRKLAEKLNISTAERGKPKKADGLNSELTAAGAYSKLDQKNVTAWLGLRNHAAHGEYDKYTKDQVALMMQGVRDFLTRYAA